MYTFLTLVRFSAATNDVDTTPKLALPTTTMGEGGKEGGRDENGSRRVNDADKVAR